MDNQETLTTFGTEATERRQKNLKKNNRKHNAEQELIHLERVFFTYTALLEFDLGNNCTRKYIFYRNNNAILLTGCHKK
jgi:hypothetical protein